MSGIILVLVHFWDTWQLVICCHLWPIGSHLGVIYDHLEIIVTNWLSFRTIWWSKLRKKPINPNLVFIRVFLGGLFFTFSLSRQPEQISVSVTGQNFCQNAAILMASKLGHSRTEWFFLYLPFMNISICRNYYYIWPI